MCVCVCVCVIEKLSYSGCVNYCGASVDAIELSVNEK